MLAAYEDQDPPDRALDTVSVPTCLTLPYMYPVRQKSNTCSVGCKLLVPVSRWVQPHHRLGGRRAESLPTPRNSLVGQSDTSDTKGRCATPSPARIAPAAEPHTAVGDGGRQRLRDPRGMNTAHIDELLDERQLGSELCRSWWHCAVIEDEHAGHHHGHAH